MKDKLAEQILFKYRLKARGMTEEDMIKAMQAYHEAKMKEVTDEDIENWIDKRFARVSRYGLGKSIGAFIAAKAFRDGEIKCNREV